MLPDSYINNGSPSVAKTNTFIAPNDYITACFTAAGSSVLAQYWTTFKYCHPPLVTSWETHGVQVEKSWHFSLKPIDSKLTVELLYFSLKLLIKLLLKYEYQLLFFDLALNTTATNSIYVNKQHISTVHATGCSMYNIESPCTARTNFLWSTTLHFPHWHDPPTAPLPQSHSNECSRHLFTGFSAYQPFWQSEAWMVRGDSEPTHRAGL